MRIIATFCGILPFIVFSVLSASALAGNEERPVPAYTELMNGLDSTAVKEEVICACGYESLDQGPGEYFFYLKLVDGVKAQSREVLLRNIAACKDHWQKQIDAGVCPDKDLN